MSGRNSRGDAHDQFRRKWRDRPHGEGQHARPPSVHVAAAYRRQERRLQERLIPASRVRNRRRPGAQSPKSHKRLLECLTSLYSMPGARLAQPRVWQQDWTCTWCEKPLTPEDIGASRTQLDHVIPAIRGGPHASWNKELLHSGCNASKGDRMTAKAWTWQDGTRSTSFRPTRQPSATGWRQSQAGFAGLDRYWRTSMGRAWSRRLMTTWLASLRKL
jgi:5-methylcytosine-specific restriction endonuclease McrA